MIEKNMWRQKVTHVSEHLFPGLSNYSHDIYDERFEIGTEVLSNLPLQIALYFNVIYFPCWLVVTFTMLPYKFWDLNALHQLILSLTLASVILIECIRLYMGYLGNLKEKIPELAGFWLISILLQTPLQIFLLVCQTLRPSLLEFITQLILCIFLFVQLVYGFIALRHAAKHSADIFNFSNFNTESHGQSCKID